MLRSAFTYVCLFCAFCLGLSGVNRAWSAGYRSITVPAEERQPALRGLVWYPCQSAGSAQAESDAPWQGVRDCVPTGRGWPLVVMSHGSGGSAIGHHDTAAALADAGFVVVATNHPGDNYRDLSSQGDLRIFVSRPQDSRRLIDYMQKSWPEHRRLAVGKVGFFGFSRGGYTGLALAGARPDYTLAARRCESEVLPLCQQVARGELPALPHADGRIEAMVLADPLNLFTAAGLQKVTIPVQLWASEYGGDGVEPQDNEFIRTHLPRPPEYHPVAKADHFSFLAPCSPIQAREIPVLCAEPEGFDRERFHQRFNADVVQFFTKTLK